MIYREEKENYGSDRKNKVLIGWAGEYLDAYCYIFCLLPCIGKILSSFIDFTPQIDLHAVEGLPFL